MKGKIYVSALLVVLILFLAGCEAPTCYPPNKILDNKCCIDDDDNDICDYEAQLAAEAEEAEKETEEQEEEALEAPEEAEMEKETEEQAETLETDEPEAEPEPIQTGLVLGKQKMKFGEKKEYLEIHKLSAYRISRDKGMMDYMIYTVRNIGDKKLNPVVELYFEGARVGEQEVRVRKEYVLEPLEPGEKHVIKKSLGIRFSGIDETKEIELSVYEQFIAPRDDLKVLRKEFVPTDLFESMEIYTYGLPED